MKKSLNLLICNSLLLPGLYSVNAAAYYSSNIGGYRTKDNTWTTSGNGKAPNATSLSQSRHMVSIEDGYTAIVNAADTTSNLFVGDDLSGIHHHPLAANCGLSLTTSMMNNTGISAGWIINRIIRRIIVPTHSNQPHLQTPYALQDRANYLLFQSYWN